MSKLLKTFLACLLTATLCVSIPLAATALESESGAENPLIYQLSPPIPEDAVSYATNRVGDYLITHLESLNYDLTDTYQLGSPFVLDNPEGLTLYYFPILNNGAVVFTFFVFLGDDQEYHGVMSSALVDDLNELAGEEVPSRMVVSNNIGEFVPSPAAAYSDDESLVNAGMPMMADILVMSPSTLVASASSKYLWPTVFETQDFENDNWCVGYVCASIINSSTNFRIHAEYIANKVGVYDKSTPIPYISAFEWINYNYNFNIAWGMDNLFVIGSYDNLISEIDNDHYVYLGASARNADGDEQILHAALLRGYSESSTAKLLCVWDPLHGYKTADVNRNYAGSFGMSLYLYGYAAGWHT